MSNGKSNQPSAANTQWLVAINVLLKWTLFLAGPHIQAIRISSQLWSNVDIKDSWVHQILQMAHKNFKRPIKIWKFAYTVNVLKVRTLKNNYFFRCS